MIDETLEPIKKLIEDQKLEAAKKKLAELRRSTDPKTRLVALSLHVQLELATHKIKTAVEELLQLDISEEPIEGSLQNWMVVQALTQYLNQYRWEIQQRERVSSSHRPEELKYWTIEDVDAEILKRFASIWQHRSTLGGMERDTLANFTTETNYPWDVRPTILDTMIFLMVQHFANTGSWSPSEQNEVFTLNFNSLLNGSAQRLQVDLASDAHPLRKLTYLLAALEEFHRERKAAALESRLERVRHLFASYADDNRRKVLVTHIDKSVGRYEGTDWLARARAVQAELLLSMDYEGHKIDAHSYATMGLQYNESLGVQQCRSLLARIEQPSLNLEAMAVDTSEKPSIQIRYQNLASVQMRAVPLKKSEIIGVKGFYGFQPEQEFLRKMESRQPKSEWEVSLPPTTDYETHTAYSSLPKLEPGAYLLYASNRAFRDKDGYLIGQIILVTDYVTKRERIGNDLHVHVLRGDTGEAISGATVAQFRYKYSDKMQWVAEKKTDKNGLAVFSARERNGQTYIVAEVGDQWTADIEGMWMYGRGRSADERKEGLIFTDRAIYRPGQEIMWKLQAVSVSKKGIKPRVGVSFPVELRDANGEIIETMQVKTNAYGTTAGKFQIPVGRALGFWSIRSSGFTRGVRVEEYKRPTMKAELVDPTKAMRMNEPIELSGNASYYFGAPVSDGKFVWSVSREPVFSGWYSWYWSRNARQQVVASGEERLKTDGSFSFQFIPQAERPVTAEERNAVKYRYRVTGTVTDSGGETTAVSRQYLVGWVDLTASLALDDTVLTEGDTPELRLNRYRLNGSPVGGKGRWTLYQLQQPQEVVLRPVKVAPRSSRYDVPGDARKARWEEPDSVAEYLASWQVGEVVGEGEIVADEKGFSTAEMPPLMATAYRLHYESQDEYGESYSISKDFFALGEKPALQVPFVTRMSSSRATVGETVELEIYTPFPGIPVVWGLYQGDKIFRQETVVPAGETKTVRFKVTDEYRGGVSIKVAAMVDYLPMSDYHSLAVGWPEQALSLDFKTFRERIRPGESETWTLQIKDHAGNALQKTAEVLAFMYDKSLDVFTTHGVGSPLSLLPSYYNHESIAFGIRRSGANWVRGPHDMGHDVPSFPSLSPSQLRSISSFGIGGPGMRHSSFLGANLKQAGGRGYALAEAEGEVAEYAASEAPAEPVASAPAIRSRESISEEKAKESSNDWQVEGGGGAIPDAQMRNDFRETAFWFPQLLAKSDGTVEIKFEVPDSVTEWQVFTTAVTKNLQFGSGSQQTKSVKDLLVRPYLPRFLRVGDENEIKVVVNNTSDEEMQGKMRFAIVDPATEADRTADFGLEPKENIMFSVPAGESRDFSYSLQVPRDLGEVIIGVQGETEEFADGEQRRLPILPARVHLAQSRFAALKDTAPRTLKFDLDDNDQTRIEDKLVVAVDAQLIGGVLKALPYLVSYPYECTEQTLNRFLSTAIVDRAFGQSKFIQAFAEKMKSRKTQFEAWDANDPNRRMLLEETPWLQTSRGGSNDDALVNILDANELKQQMASSLRKLKKAQLTNGGFPWYAGGRASTYMTLYILTGLARAAEFGIELDPQMIKRALGYIAGDYRATLMQDHGLAYLVQLAHMYSALPQQIAKAGLNPAERKAILDYTWTRKTDLSPYLKSLMALALHRDGRTKNAVDLLEVVFDTAKVDEDLGLYWAPEDRSWLWYNDTIETHAFALRALTEILPQDHRRQPMVQWLFLNKKLNHWKSTRATAEVLYSLIYYLKQEGQLGQKEVIEVSAGGQDKTFSFSPDVYQGDNARWVLTENLEQPQSKEVTARRTSKGLAFVTATWHFSTEQPPQAGDGDLFAVSRKYFKRSVQGAEMQLTPIDEIPLQVGDEVEVHLSIQAKHAAEYVHLRDPRPAGFEPGVATSGWQWSTGIVHFKEVRDSATNFFFEWLPAGEYTLKYRVRVQAAGKFQAAPAFLQSMYAPEFTSYSGSSRIDVPAG